MTRRDTASRTVENVDQAVENVDQAVENVDQAVENVDLMVFDSLFSSVAEEMGVALMRSSFSPNIKERRDFSCALFDASRQMVALAAHIPVHLGSTPLSVKAVLDTLDLEPGDVAILNDPFAGGTHLPDITMVAPVFLPGAGGAGRKGQPDFFTASRAHHADVGGMTPGSMGTATEIFQEGVRIPPLKIVKRGVLQEDLLALILNQVRTPRERRGDFRAQLAAGALGARRLETLAERYGSARLQSAAAALIEHAQAIMEGVIRAIPDGTWHFEDALDDDGFGSGPLPIRLRLTVRGKRLVVDFTGTADQTRGPVNANLAVTLSAVFYVLLTLAPEESPANWGAMRPVTVKAPAGSLVNARFPAAVAGGNVETSQRIVDVLLGAFAQALPDRIPAASSGTMCNLSLGGSCGGEPFAYYETLAGGAGATAGEAGASAVQCHMTNTMNTPVEALEPAYPLRVRRLALRRGSGGRGRRAGGDGIERELELLEAAEVSLLSDRTLRGPYGLSGGGRGKTCSVRVRTGRRARVMPGKFTTSLGKGTVIVIGTPGGGGHGGS
jgi:N-methylhydantoinase B